MDLLNTSKYEYQSHNGSKVKVKIEAEIKELHKEDLEEILHEFAIRTRNFYLSLGRKIADATSNKL